MPTNQHPEDIKAAVRKTGISLAELARQNGLASVSGRRCLYEPVPRANRAIADHLGVPLHELWPEWFDEAGARIARFRRDSSSRPEPAQRQKGAAA